MDSESKKYVSRGAQKLLGALKDFQISPLGLTCADLGCSTGGFTEVLLEKGAAHVYAIDTAYGELAWKLRNHAQVTVMERVDARRIEELPESIDLITIDISLIHLEKILQSIAHWVPSNTSIIALFKSQYQVRDKSLLKKGVIQDEQTMRKTFQEFYEWLLQANHWSLLKASPSAIRGSSGNQEVFFHLKRALEDPVWPSYEQYLTQCGLPTA